jgi:hypothetical protein
MKIRDKNNPEIVICNDLFRETFGLYAFHEKQLPNIISSQMEIDKNKYQNQTPPKPLNHLTETSQTPPEHTIVAPNTTRIHYPNLQHHPNTLS